MSATEWRVEFDAAAAAAKELQKFDSPDQRRILKFLRERVSGKNDPRRTGPALAGEFAGLWRYRIGDYRLIAAVEDRRFVVLVLRVGHRREIYR